MITIRANLFVAAGAALLMTAAGCASPAPVPSAMRTPTATATTAASSTRTASSAGVTRPATSTVAPVPWQPVGVHPIDDQSPAVLTSAPTDLPQCSGSDFRLLPSSGRTTSTSGGFLTTTFVVRYIGPAACSMNPGLLVVTMTAADGTIVPIDSMPAGPAFPPLRIAPRQLVFGSINWSVAKGRPRPTHLSVTLGDSLSVRPISIAVADVTIPPHPTDSSPENAVQSTAYGVMTSAADPGTVATLAAAVTAPTTVHIHSTLQYTVTLTNPTDTAVPLTGCPQFIEELTVVPLKTAVSVGARGPLNCADLPPAMAANSSVTMQMELDTAGQVPGPGQLTWYLVDRGDMATAPVTVH